MGLIGKVVLSVVIAVIVTLACILLGGILVTLNVSIAVVVGMFLKGFSSAIGVLAGLYYFFSR